MSSFYKSADYFYLRLISRKVSKMQPIRVLIAETEHPIKSPEILLAINHRTLIGRNRTEMSEREDLAIIQNCPQWISRFSNQDLGYSKQTVFSSILIFGYLTHYSHDLHYKSELYTM